MAGNDALGTDVPEGGEKPGHVESAVGSESETTERRRRRKLWARLIRRVYEVGSLVCPCGAMIRIVSVITEQNVVTKILTHLSFRMTSQSFRVTQNGTHDAVMDASSVARSSIGCTGTLA